MTHTGINYAEQNGCDEMNRTLLALCAAFSMSCSGVGITVTATPPPGAMNARVLVAEEGKESGLERFYTFTPVDSEEPEEFYIDAFVDNLPVIVSGYALMERSDDTDPYEVIRLINWDEVEIEVFDLYDGAPITVSVTVEEDDIGEFFVIDEY